MLKPPGFIKFWRFLSKQTGVTTVATQKPPGFIKPWGFLLLFPGSETNSPPAPLLKREGRTRNQD